MARLDEQRQNTLEPKRMAYCKEILEKLGFKVERVGNTLLRFSFKESVVTVYPYSGWHSGKTIIDGRGFKKLIKQITK